MCAIPFALAQSGTRAASHNLPADAETESMAPATLAPAVVAYIPNSGSNNVVSGNFLGLALYNAKQLAIALFAGTQRGFGTLPLAQLLLQV